MNHLRAAILLFAATCLAAPSAALAQGPRLTPPFRSTPAPKKASELIRKQDPPMIEKSLAETITPENSHIRVSLAKQRAYLMIGEAVYIDTPVSTGKKRGSTPIGTFKITQKIKDHRSSIYGDFVDKKGRIVRAGVSTRTDSAPSGTRYIGAPMKWFCRFNGAVGMHVGKLPGYPASHGCVRLPEDIAPLIYEKVKIGTPVVVVVE